MLLSKRAVFGRCSCFHIANPRLQLRFFLCWNGHVSLCAHASTELPNDSSGSAATKGWYNKWQWQQPMHRKEVSLHPDKNSQKGIAFVSKVFGVIAQSWQARGQGHTNTESVRIVNQTLNNAAAGHFVPWDTNRPWRGWQTGNRTAYYTYNILSHWSCAPCTHITLCARYSHTVPHHTVSQGLRGLVERCQYRSQNICKPTNKTQTKEETRN